MDGMTSWTGMLAAVLLLGPGTAAAGDDPVVVELFTSQGCSSCPPADAILRELATRVDVLPLALHVDYWDYIGWADVFADPAHTRRQRGYAKAAGERMVYTPQMVVGGADRLAGTRPMELAEAIRRHRAAPDAVDLTVSRGGGSVAIRATADAPAAMVVQLVTYRPEAEVEIARGENAGHRGRYANVVTSWRTLGAWDGTAPLEVTVPVEGPAAVIVQAAGQGPVLAAARLR